MDLRGHGDVLPSLKTAAACAAAAFALAAPPAALAQGEPLRVGSKRFTESYILGEILVQSAAREGVAAVHRPGLGNTAILYEALTRGAIDAYPEYTGTIAREILKSGESLDLAAINRRLAPLGLAASTPLGFSNGYALGMQADVAKRHGIARISDLARHPALRPGLSHEFLGRQDGWPGLKAAYGLPQPEPRGLDHGLAYEALAKAEVDVIDLYTTDAKIARYGVKVLEDDRNFFPRYDAVILHRGDAPSRHAQAFAAWSRLQGRLDEGTMIGLNARAEIERIDFPAVASEFLGARETAKARTLASALFAPDFGRLALEHAGLVFGSLLAAIVAGIPLGLAAAKLRWIAQPVLIATGLVQTIPSLALLAFLIPITGSIGVWPALIALFLYALLPIARNTHAGILGVSPGLKEAARALGLLPRQVLAHIELPLAMPTILAGVKTSAVINVGTATIAAFIGAGGFGERIAQGLALNDHTLLIAGALPAAVLALGVHAIFEWAERGLTRRALRGPAPAPA
jgi:osmoprotectant transport system permease protein